MGAAATPPDEEERLAGLYALRILDTPPEERFDRIARLAARLLGTPIALISLVDRDRQWFKARVGMAALETPRDVSFCAHAVSARSALVVPDTLKDERFAANPLVTADPNIRFYAGHPLAGPDGHLMGTLCIIDHQPRQLSAADRSVLADLASIVENEMANRELAEAMAAQRMAEGRLRTILNAAPLGICLVDSDEVIRDCNPAFENLVGFDPGTTVGHRTSEFTHPDDLERTRAMYRSLRDGSPTGTLEKRYIRRDGAELWIELTAARFDDSAGGPTQFVAMAEDITEKREAVERLRESIAEQTAANARLAQVGAAKTHFVSVVSHEFRTALTGIQGFSEMLRDEELTPEEVHEYGADINTDALRLNRMITDMLDLDRMESGRMTLTLGRLDLNTLLRTEAGRVRSGAHSVELDLAPGLPAINADGDKLVQVVSNLLSNAVKYSPQGGPILVRSRQEGDRVCLSIRDSGVGIPPDDLDKVFDRFTRVESDSHRGISGTGLGLPIVRQIVELHGGRVWAESEAGRGTTIHLELPVDPEPGGGES